MRLRIVTPVEDGLEEFLLSEILKIAVSRIEINSFLKSHSAGLSAKCVDLASNMPLQPSMNEFLGTTTVYTNSDIAGSLHRVGKQLLAQSSKLDSLEKF